MEVLKYLDAWASDMKVICTVGYPGSGKSEAQIPAESHDIPIIEMGNRVRERAEDAFESDTHNIDSYSSKSDFIGKWADKQRNTHGQSIVAEWTVKYIKNHIDSSVAFVDGLRSPEGLDVLRTEFDDVLVIYVKASPETRRKRLGERGRNGEGRDEFEERTQRESEWGVPDTIELADVTIENEGDITSFYKAVDAEIQMFADPLS